MFTIDEIGFSLSQSWIHVFVFWNSLIRYKYKHFKEKSVTFIIVYLFYDMSVILPTTEKLHISYTHIVPEKALVWFNSCLYSTYSATKWTAVAPITIRSSISTSCYFKVVCFQWVIEISTLKFGKINSRIIMKRLQLRAL